MLVILKKLKLSLKSLKIKSLRKTQKKAKTVRTTTVMFIEFSKGGMLQKKMRETLDRVTPMMGFKVRVEEKGGTTLGSL